MPFKSKAQLTLLRWKHPDVYKRWAKKYGTKIQGSKKPHEVRFTKSKKH